MREKIEGVKDCLKIVREEIKTAKKELEIAENDCRAYGSFDDCSDSFRTECVRKQQHLDSLIQMKIKLENTLKNLATILIENILKTHLWILSQFKQGGKKNLKNMES